MKTENELHTITETSIESSEIVPFGPAPRSSDIAAWEKQLVADAIELRRRNPPMSEALRRRQITI